MHWNLISRLLKKSTPRRILKKRAMVLEQLQRRDLLTAYFNPYGSFDVNNDDLYSPVDALLPINKINRDGTGGLPEIRQPDEPFYDTNGDGLLTPVDVLLVINVLNAGEEHPRKLLDTQRLVTEKNVEVPVGDVNGTLSYSFGLGPLLGPKSSEGQQDQLNVYVDAPLPDPEAFDEQRVFTLSDSGHERTPAMSFWNGDELVIDVSSYSGLDSVVVRFQLLNHDPTFVSSVTVGEPVRIVDSAEPIAPFFTMPSEYADTGNELDVGALIVDENLSVEYSYSRYDRLNGRYELDLTVHNEGTASWQDAAILLADLPSGVEVSNASGVFGDIPYINLSNAIGRGGIGQNEYSLPLTLEILAPFNQAFTLSPTLLVGAANNAPEIPSIPDVLIRPGEIKTIELPFTDSDGDAIDYSVLSDSTYPGVSVDPGGVTIAPNPSDVGTYALTVIAEDGEVSAERTFVVQVLDDVSTTRIQGQVLNIDGTPIVGLVVELGAISSITDTTGMFEIDSGTQQLVSDTLRFRGDLLSGTSAYPFVAEKLPLILEHDVFEGYQNQIIRPVYLPVLNAGSTIDPAINQTVGRSLVDGETPAEVFISAGSLFEQSGAPFDGELSITEVPVERTPAALPVNLLPDLVVTIQPGEMSFATPAPISLPNRSGLPAGAILDLWSINPTTGAFEIVGQGEVTSDGSMVSTVTGGIRNSSWHFFNPPPPAPPDPNIIRPNQDNNCSCGGNNSSDDGCDSPSGGGCEASENGDSAVELHSGAYREWHDLVTYQSLGETRGWTLRYNSETANPIKVVHAGYDNVPASSETRLSVGLKISRGGLALNARSGGRGGTIGFLPERLPPQNLWRTTSGGNLRVGVPLNFAGYSSGLYRATISSGLVRAGAGGQPAGTMVEQPLDFSVFNRTQSSVGAGWGIGGLLELVENPDGSLLMLNGSGSQLLFGAPTGNLYSSPAGDFSELTKTASGYQRVFPDTSMQTFQADGKLSGIVDRNGNTTNFTWGQFGIERISDPVGLTTQFQYSNGLLNKIVDPANRETVLSHDANGNLISIRDPDGSERRFAYDSSHLLVRETDKRGFEERVFYNSEGRVTKTISGDGTERFYEAAQNSSSIARDANAGFASATEANVEATFVARTTDYNGNVRTTRLDRLGQAVSTSDSIGPIGGVQRNSDNLISTTIDGRSNVTQYKYDSRGNVIEISELITTDPGLQNPSISWIGANSGDWDDPNNWSEGRVPNSTDQVLIAPTDEVTISVRRQTAVVNRLYTAANVTLDIAIADLVLTGRSRIAGPLVLGQTGALVARSGAEISILGTTTFSQQGGFRSEEGTIAANNLVSVESATLSAAGGVLELLAVESASNSVVSISQSGELRVPNLSEVDQTRLQATDGGVLDLPNIRTMSSNAFRVLRADGVGSRISLPNLTTFESTVTGGSFRTSISAERGGVLDLPQLTDLQSGRWDWFIFDEGSQLSIPLLTSATFVNATFRRGGDLDAPNLTRFSEGELELDDSALTLPALRDISETALILRNNATPLELNEITAWENSSYHVHDGINLRLPYPTMTGRWQTILEARGPGSTIVAPNLTTIFSTGSGGFRTNLLATNSGSIDLPVLTTVNTGTVRFISESNQSLIGAAIAKDLSAVFVDIRTGTSVLVPQVEQLRDLISDGEFELEADAVTISGAFDQRANGVFVAKRDPSLTEPIISIGGRATLSGEFQIDFESEPDANYSFVGLTFGSRSGEFASISATKLPSGFEAVGSYSDTQVEITISPAGSGEGYHSVDGYTRNRIGSRILVGGFIGPLQAEGEHDGNSHGEQTVTRQFTYDASFNQLTSFTDELGRVTEYGIDPANGNRVSMTYPNGDSVSYTYLSNGLLDTMTNARGIVTDYDYDQFGRMTKATYAKGTADEAVTQYEYDLAGNVTAMIDANGNRTEYQYDAMNRLVKTIEADPDGNGPQTPPASEFAYDLAGNLTVFTDALGHETTNRYDARDRLFETIGEDPDGMGELLAPVTSYGYDASGNLVRVTNPLGNSTTYTYDARNRRIESIDPAGGSTKFTYDLDNNQTSLTDPVNNLTQFTYDSRDRQTSEIDPLGNAINYSYDVVDNLVSKVDRIGRETTYDYDLRDRLTTETWIGGGNTIQYAYDAESNLLSANDLFSSLAWTYDSLDRTLSEDNIGTPDAPHVVLTTSYDAFGNVLMVSDRIEGTLGATTSYVYDALNRLQAIAQQGDNIRLKRVEYAYNPLGQYTSLRRHNDLTSAQSQITTSYAYDQLNRLTELDHQGTNSQSYASFGYSYDVASRIKQIQELNQVIEYQYDSRDQLTAADYSDVSRSDESFAYDANGNRESSNLAGDAYETGTANRMVTDGVYDYEYDKEGNVTRRIEITTGDIREFVWDYRNRLTELSDKLVDGVLQKISRYTYDSLGRRISKQVDLTPGDGIAAPVEQYLYDGDDVILDFVKPAGSGTGFEEATRYLHGPGVDNLLAIESGHETKWVLQDHLGSTRSLVSSTGTVIQAIEYDSFGRPIVNGEPLARHLFTGREYDLESGLLYFRARYYSASTGRFTNEDPIGFAGGQENLRSYVDNLPTSLKDPRGLAAQAPVGVGVSIGIAIEILQLLRAGWTFSQILALLEEIGAPDPAEEAERCRQAKDACIDKCTDDTLPTCDFGASFDRCMADCMEDSGCGGKVY